ncbi:MAG: hypothetical protein AAGD23_02550 [Pseudomonadota bacterium]
MALIIAAALFALFTINVGMGSFADSSFLGDVGEMLVLFAASIAFVVAILNREAAAAANHQENQ